MKTPARVVIGANFGDEGKGLFTDYLTVRKNYERHLVIRYNGGAQARHTVVTPEGKRHVFRHFSSGTFNGATTFLSAFFVVNPILFKEEWEQLASIGVTPKVLVDPRAIVTTHFDMYLNAALEEARGVHRHGSCGVGINETIRRNTSRPYGIIVDELLEKDYLREKLEDIRGSWLHHRLAEARLPEALDPRTEDIDSEDNIKQWLEAVDFFLAHVGFRHAHALIEDWTVTFEGAQGLLLDQNAQFFPNVTPSYTGLPNVLAICDEMNIENLNVHYITRPYVTRHGAGELPGERTNPYKGFEDKTNVENQFQGALRFAPINVGILAGAIQIQRYLPSDRYRIESSFVMTCLDHIAKDESAMWIEEGQTIRDIVGALMRRIQYYTGMSVKHVSHGPTRDDVSERR